MASVFHYRESSGIEVDVVIELDDGRFLGLEVKAKQTYKPEHFRGLQRLAERVGDRFLGGVVLGTSDQGVRFGENLVGYPSPPCGSSDWIPEAQEFSGEGVEELGGRRGRAAGG
ncbi:hypothetical protein [Nocardia sp. NPDC058705]|uniref:hypothetical protein n=1 Tax=Nocardia sp. NPDC058705 TaxID=3346609 RepID=UPI0036B0AA52